MFNIKHLLSLLLTFVLVGAVFVLATGTRAGAASLPGEEKIWTTWRATHYALIDDGPILWIGTGTGLIRYQKENGQHIRFTEPDGFPQRRVYSGAVDSAGNRWFGGDNGLSRLNAGDQWTHFDTSSSGLHSNEVDGIAVSAAGDVWLSHGASPQISHRRPDGTWQVFINRQDAVTSAYTAVKETTNDNKLWTVSGGEVWAGYEVYDGVQWRTRRPETAYGDPRAMAAGSQGTIWALDQDNVFRWQGNRWATYFIEDDFYQAELVTLAIDAADNVWVAGQRLTYRGPYQTLEIAYTHLTEKPGLFELDQTLYHPPPLVGLLPTPEGFWWTGHNWLLRADGKGFYFNDGPFNRFINEFFVDGHGIRRLSSGNGTIQIVDDKGTGTMQDDTWAYDDSLHGPLDSLELVEDGDFWMSENPDCYHCFPSISRYHDGQTIYYPQQNWDSENYDIFAEDSRHTWFVFADLYWDGYSQVPVINHLDDGGTPADIDDDVWTEYPTPPAAHKETFTGHHLVAVANGRLWYGHPTGIYRQQGQDWERISQQTPYGFVAAADGTLIVNLSGSDVLLISPDGKKTQQTVAGLVAARPGLIRSTTRRNQMWTVAPDGAIWYWNDERQLVRWHERGMQINDAPASAPHIEVDRSNHVWLVSDGSLWRMSPKPDFDISSGPAGWLMTPNESRAGNITAVDISGYAGEITLAIADLPPGISAEIAPPLVKAGQTAVLTLTAGDIPLGEYSFTIQGTAGEKTRMKTVKLHIVREVNEVELPLVLLSY